MSETQEKFRYFEEYCDVRAEETPTEVNPYFMPQADSIEVEVKTDAEADEFWSYVGRKKNQM